jgi:hypothetical protein
MVFIGFLLFICLSSAKGLNAQPAARRAAVNEVLPVIAVQDDCPLMIESFAITFELNHRYAPVYRVKNVSSKNITSYRIAQIFDVGSGSMKYGVMPMNKILVRGQTVGTFDSNDNLSGPPAYEGKLKAVAFIMIVSVSFEDGTSYTAEKLYDTFKERLTEYRVE